MRASKIWSEIGNVSSCFQQQPGNQATPCRHHTRLSSVIHPSHGCKAPRCVIQKGRLEALPKGVQTSFMMIHLGHNRWETRPGKAWSFLPTLGCPPPIFPSTESTYDLPVAGRAMLRRTALSVVMGRSLILLRSSKG